MIHPTIVIAHVVAGRVVTKQITCSEQQIKDFLAERLPNEWSTHTHLRNMLLELKEKGEATRVWFDEKAQKSYEVVMLGEWK